MCGINGILFLDNALVNRPERYFQDTVARMNDSIAHRGPDGGGVHVRYPICLGHRRLAILDLSQNAAQPMLNEDGSLAIVFNGEIYNYIELAETLKKKGYVFRSHSDTEVILYCYEEYGPDCVKLFNGMWAFVIYDFKKQLLFGSRDRFGVKPFYYYKDDQSFVFSSEIKAILQYKGTSDAHLGKLYDYLAYGYQNNNGDTFFKGIHELKPAHNLIIRENRMGVHRYWDFGADPQDIRCTDDLKKLTEEFLDLLTDAVKIRFRSDVEVGILLSGGLDSSALTAIVDDLISNGSLQRYKQVSAYSAVFPGFALDESSRIHDFMKMCRRIKLEERSPTGTDLLASIENFVYGMGEPVFSATSFVHQELMKSVRESGIKVVLNGQGSDEAFCGYGRYIIGYFLLDVLMSEPGSFVRQTKAISRTMHYSYPYIASQIAKAMMSRRQASLLRAKYQEKMLGCLSRDFTEKNVDYFHDESFPVCSPRRLDTYLQSNIRDYSFTQILHYEDHSSMQQSVEIRSPFVDYRLMEFAFRLPAKHKFDMGVTKKIIREAFAHRLPPSIKDNHDKIGFVTPFNSWLKDRAFKSFVDDTIRSSSFRSKSIWEADVLASRFEQAETNHAFPYWRILNVELWSKCYGIQNL